MICDARFADIPINDTIDDLLAVITIKLHTSKNETSMAYTRGYARIFLAELYINGQDVRKNYHKAKEILDNLLSLNDYQSIDAQYLLGTFCQHGLGIKKDLIRAQEYYIKSCSRDHQKACNALNNFFDRKLKTNYLL